MVTPTWACVEGRLASDAFQRLKAGLSYTDPDVHWTWAGKRGQDSGRRTYLSQGRVDIDGTPRTGVLFPAGLAHRARKALWAAKAPFEEETGGRPPLPVPNAPTGLPDGLALYPEQVQALQVALREQRGLLALATNAGKSEVVAGLCLAHPTRRVLILVNAGVLAKQIRERLQARLGVEVGEVGQGKVRTGPRITVAMIQTLIRWGAERVERQFGDVDLLLVDECHGITPTWHPLLAAIEAPMRLGLSGTVHEARKPSRLAMEAFLGPVLHTVTESSLAEAGRSATPTILMPWVAGWGYLSGDYRDRYETGIVKNTQRNGLLLQIAQEAVALGLRTLILVYRRPHGRWFEAHLQQAGISCAWVSGERPEAIAPGVRDFERGRVQVLVGSTVLATGINVPSIQVILQAAGWKSPTATAQKLGRGLRLKPADLGAYWTRRVVIVDPDDKGSDMAIRWAGERAQTYQRRGFPVHRGRWEDLRGLLGPSDLETHANRGVSEPQSAWASK